MAAATRAAAVLERGHAPALYLAPDDVDGELLALSARPALCAFKGRGEYLDVVVGSSLAPDAAWRYPEPDAGYERWPAGWRSFRAPWPWRQWTDGGWWRPTGTAAGLLPGLVGPFRLPPS